MYASETILSKGHRVSIGRVLLALRLRYDYTVRNVDTHKLVALFALALCLSHIFSQSHFQASLSHSLPFHCHHEVEVEQVDTTSGER
jgi:hypothetical protein